MEAHTTSTKLCTLRSFVLKNKKEGFHAAGITNRRK
jgi:hypothetical protein